MERRAHDRTTVEAFVMYYMQLKWHGVPDAEAAWIAYQEFDAITELP